MEQVQDKEQIGSEPGLEILEDIKISVLPMNQNITHPNPTHLLFSAEVYS
jgi:hypothetical protein